MTHQCAVPGCLRPVGGGKRARAWTRHCNTHRAHDRRHGHPQQTPVTVSKQLKPYLKMIDRRLKVQPEARAWDAASERWRALADEAASTVLAYDRGEAMSSTAHGVAQEIDKLAKAAEPKEVWRLIAALVMLSRREETVFRTDRSFFVQAGRVIRRLRDVNATEFWSPTEGKVRRTYRDPQPRVMEELGRKVSIALGAVGLAFLRLEDAEEQRQDQAKADLRSALDELTSPQVAPG